jgi:hypothetical protein
MRGSFAISRWDGPPGLSGKMATPELLLSYALITGDDWQSYEQAVPPALCDPAHAAAGQTAAFG